MCYRTCSTAVFAVVVSLFVGSHTTFAACPDFGGAVNRAAGSTPSSVTSGDFNRDGLLDIAVANAGTDNVSVFIGSGNGSFNAAVNYAAGGTPTSIVTADFNRD